MENQLLFALDIGTRSVVGIVGQRTENGLEITATERQEHHTRSMLDGQIHDVTEVAQVLSKIKARLEKSCGPLRQVAVAAAGRSLCTVRAHTELDTSCRGALTLQDERTLEIAAIQAAQRQLSTSDEMPDPAAYYCVGYSVTGFSLDGTKLSSLVGQRGKSSSIEIIATFLPRQVIDSMQSALEAANLELATLTLEPIAAINVLIPKTMRHLNLALVDIGAGTSDVAITRNGAVVAYGMVPSAGDEITEAISQQYLLDFNVAESAKRQLTQMKKVSFSDVLGSVQKVVSADIIEAIKPTIAELASDIAAEILALNGTSPQAVLLVGGGSLTPMLPQAIAQCLDLPPARVAIRRPETVEGIRQIPVALSAPDGVTPLGILKVAAKDTLHFITVRVNDNPLRLFNLSSLSVADALLTAGIDVRTLHGRPGFGLTITLNGETRFLPGEAGEPGQILLNGEPAKLSDAVSDSDAITIIKGKNGASPHILVDDVAEMTESSVCINQISYQIPAVVTINGKPVDRQTVLCDRDVISCRRPATISEVCHAAGVSFEPRLFRYIINGTQREYLAGPVVRLNGQIAAFDAPVDTDASIEIVPADPPTIGEVLGIDPDESETVSVYFNGVACTLLTKRHSIYRDNRSVEPAAPAVDGAIITYTLSTALPTISDVLLAAEFSPDTLPPGCKPVILLNGQATEYISPVKNGDKIDLIQITP